jgi:glutaconate CoA-transferase subunit B
MTAPTIRELMAIAIARELSDGEIAMTGASSVIPVAACLLAQQLHAPNLTLILPSGVVNPAPGRLFRSASDGRWAARAEAIGTAYDLFELSENGRLDVMFYGGIQIDRYGNINLTHVGGTFRSPRFRGPGLANISFAVTCKRFLLYTTRHDRRTLVEKVDYLTAPGHLDGTGGREGAGITTAGPQLCVTPLAVMDFSGPGSSMAVRYLQPGVAAEQVIDATGFSLGSSQGWAWIPAPTNDELVALRTVVDTTGALRDATEGGTVTRQTQETML